MNAARQRSKIRDQKMIQSFSSNSAQELNAQISNDVATTVFSDFKNEGDAYQQIENSQPYINRFEFRDKINIQTIQKHAHQSKKSQLAETMYSPSPMVQGRGKVVSSGTGVDMADGDRSSAQKNMMPTDLQHMVSQFGAPSFLQINRFKPVAEKAPPQYVAGSQHSSFQSYRGITANQYPEDNDNSSADPIQNFSEVNSLIERIKEQQESAYRSNVKSIFLNNGLEKQMKIQAPLKMSATFRNHQTSTFQELNDFEDSSTRIISGNHEIQVKSRNTTAVSIENSRRMSPRAVRVGNPLTATKMKLEHQFIPDAYKTFQNAKFMTIKHNLQISDKPVVTAPISHRRGDRHGKYGFRTSQQKWLETPSNTYRSVNRKKHSVDAHMQMRFPNIKSVAQTPLTNTKSSATGYITQENDRAQYQNANPLKHSKINLKHRWKTPHLRDLASNSSV